MTFCGVLLCAFLLWPPIKAQSQDTQFSSSIEEIVVTATKRETSPLRTPLSISAIQGSLLEDLGAESFDDYYSRVPALGAVENGPGRKS